MKSRALNIGVNFDGKPFSLPLETVTATIAILAIKGKGKTYLSDVFNEELMSAGQMPVIIDYTGAHWGLKSSADGKSAGFPVVIFGGEHADLPLSETAGEVIAQAIVEQRFPAILDVSMLRKGAANRFLGDFMEALYRLNRLPIQLICDEADAYAPQKPFGDQARTLGAIEDIVRRGRVRGIGCTLITQRPQVINKNVLTQCEILVALGMSHPKDIGAIKEWIDVHGDTAKATAMISSLPALAKGVAWFWAPSMDLFDKVQVRTRTTFDSSATPKPGEARRIPQKLADIDISKLGAEIAATAERAKADDPKALKARIKQLEVDLAKKPAAAPAERVEVSIFTEGDRKLITELSQVFKNCDLAFSNLGVLAEELVAKVATHSVGRGVSGPVGVHNRADSGRAPVAKSSATVRPTRAIPNGSAPADGTLSKAEIRILTVLAQHSDGCDRGKLALLSGYSYSGGFRNSLSALRTSGYIEGGNEEVMSITQSGSYALGDYEVLPTGRALADFWLQSSRFGEAEREILRVLLNEPSGMDSATLAEKCGKAYSGGFRNSLSTLRTAGVIVGKNTETIRAADALFDRWT
jgi:hypothetical protein